MDRSLQSSWRLDRVHRTPLVEKIIGCAIRVHETLGPGLLESAYQTCLADEFRSHELAFECQRPLPVNYRDRSLDCAYRLDFVVEDAVLLELKSVERFSPIYEAQILTYLRLSGLKQGLLINFNARRLVDGLRSYLL